ncbi:hypothetical protein D9M73_65110 [compost metagenome]
MLKPAAITDQQFQTVQQPVDETTVNNVFKVMHGYYGNLFLSKFATGVVDDRGRDKGVGSARTVWAHSLRAFPDGVVLTALERCQVQHPDFPPSLPQFLALCKACAPREAYKPETPAIGMSQKLRSRNAAKAREINERHAARAAGRPTGAAADTGLQALKALIAGAVAAAGGDEVAELRRLDRMYATEAP